MALLWKPAPVGSFYTVDEISDAYVERCPDPYDVPPDAPAPASYEEAKAFSQEAYDASQSPIPSTVTVPGIIVSRWKTDGTELWVEADVSKVLQAHGPGVYTVMIWGYIDGEVGVVSEYSLFYEIERPVGYEQAISTVVNDRSSK